MWNTFDTPVAAGYIYLDLKDSNYDMLDEKIIGCDKIVTLYATGLDEEKESKGK